MSERDSAGVIAPPPLIYAVGIGAGLALDTFMPSTELSNAVRAGVGIPLLAAGSVLMVSFVRALSRARTAINPADETTALVSCGPYRLTRNPGYLGMALLGAGIGVTSGAVWVLAGTASAALVVDRGVIVREERYLAGKFGADYRDYCSRVRRWL